MKILPPPSIQRKKFPIIKFEPPLETPGVDPLHILLIGPVVIKWLRFDFDALKLIIKRDAIVHVSSFIAEYSVTLLRGRIKWALQSGALKFTPTPAHHMTGAGRHGPLGLLERAIRYGETLVNIVGKSGKKLEVVVDESIWTIVHFSHKRSREYARD
ncbi:hypothetical protein [Enterobacter sp.]|uniref:hypothetical protein n=1 Tax=Enterobacter sp. TaxID=42895 RepID=UPI00296FB3B0|nr:hypothetical protein [Enterobacter sp.]